MRFFSIDFIIMENVALTKDRLDGTINRKATKGVDTRL